MTDPRLCILLCKFFLPEIERLAASGKYPDVVFKGLPSCCSSQSQYSDKCKDIIHKNSSRFSKTILIGSSCITGLPVASEIKGAFTVIKLNQCFELLLNKSIIEHLIGKKYYLISSGWLRNYKNHIEEWGFDPSTAKNYFNESADKIMLLETGLGDDFKQQIEAVSGYMGLPYEIFPVGLSYLQLFIDSLVFQRREELERISFNERLAVVTGRTADYMLAFDQLNNLVDYVEETEIVRRIFALLDILFAPRNIFYEPVEDGRVCEKTVFRNGLPVPVDKDEDSFDIELVVGNNTVGIFEIIGVAFPQHIERYKDIEKIIGRIGGLAVVNARKYATIKSNEAHLQQYANELRELNASKDKFFSIIAHDLRSPFTGFLGIAELMANNMEIFTPEEFSRTSKNMHKSALTLYELLNNLLEWAQMQRGMLEFNPRKVDISILAEQSIETIVQRAEQKEITILNLVPENIKAFCDVKMISAVFRNLLSNAIKFTRMGGKVTVEARVVDGDFLEISVCDTGVGISQKSLSKLFKIGEKVGTKGTDNEPSSGLGLVLCKDFIEKHNGKIWVESVEGAGSTFYFTLPCAKRVPVDVSRN